MIKLLVVDTKITSLDLITLAMSLENKEYQENAGITIRYDIIRQDLSNLNWTPYNLDFLGVNQTWLAGETNKVDDKYYSVRYVFHEDNFKEKRVGGWHVGIINGFSLELIRHWTGNTTVSGEVVPWIYIAFLEEGMHAWDNVIQRQLGININQYFGGDYDNGFIHAELEGRERWVYDDILQKLKPFLLTLFDKPMYTLFKGTNGEIYAQGNGYVRHIVNLYTLRKGQGREWPDYGSNEDNIPKGSVTFPELDEIALLVQDSKA